MIVSLFAPALPASQMPQAVIAPSAIQTPNDARQFGLESLATIVASEGVPLPNLSGIVTDVQAARVLGKALFFDETVGSDGIQACATCHFHAGADSRAKNQLNPDTLRVLDQRNGDVKGYHKAPTDPDELFEIPTGSPSPIGPNYTLLRNDFPFVRDIGNGSNVVKTGDSVGPAAGNSNDVGSSQGVFLTDFVSVGAGDPIDVGNPQFDPIWNVNGITVRRVEPRNTPTMINAVFNFANFWDGRANNRFNGVNPFGDQDPNAKVWVADGGVLQQESISLKNASLASQAVGPPLSAFEMSFGGRTFPELGRKMISRRPLEFQVVKSDDSLLGPLRHSSGYGLNASYQKLIEESFNPKYWNYNGPVIVNGQSFTLMEANFSFFYGIAVMLYEATLVADQSPFDQWMQGYGGFVPGFGEEELRGLRVFVGDGKCINCHSGPELTGASVRNAQNGNNVIEPMLMGDQQPALYDNGFYNIGVTPTTDDLGRGEVDLNMKPLAFSRQFAFKALDIEKIDFRIEGDPIPDLVCDPASVVDPCDVIGFIDEESGNFFPVCRDANNDNKCSSEERLLLQRVAVDGAFKTPGLRNVELTGPYMHNGGFATLREVVEFYDRGGNFCRFNCEDLDPDIQQLGLSEIEKMYLVKFMISLTDDRVATKSAPFDGPQLSIPNGHPGDETYVTQNPSVPGQADDSLLLIPATGAGGGPAIGPFLGADPFSFNPVAGDSGPYGSVGCSPNFSQCGGSGGGVITPEQPQP